MALSESAAAGLLNQVRHLFDHRHCHIEEFFLKRFAQVDIYLEPGVQPSTQRQLLIGAHFTNEYAIEAAALFNPSIVPHPDQKGVAPGEVRFILSLRATGEGHVSSVTFREGLLNAKGQITLAATTPCVLEPEWVPNAAYAKGLFIHKLEEAGVKNDFCLRVLGKLHEDFTLKELHAVLLASGLTDTSDVTATWAARGILLLAESNFEVDFAADTQLSQRVLFPSAPSQSNGIETRVLYGSTMTMAASLITRPTRPTTGK